MRQTLCMVLRQLAKAQRERNALRRIGLYQAEKRAHARVQAYREMVRTVRGAL